jgi:hypothetical protein
MATAYPRCEVVGIDLLCPGIGHDNIPENCSFKTVDGMFFTVLNVYYHCIR